MSLTTALQVVFAWLPSILPVLGDMTSLALYTIAFAFLYHYLPDRRVRWRQALLGGLITAGLFVLGRWAIGLYLSEAAPGRAYGSMGALRSEEHTAELPSLMRISYAVFCLKT